MRLLPVLPDHSPVETCPGEYQCKQSYRRGAFQNFSCCSPEMKAERVRGVLIAAGTCLVSDAGEYCEVQNSRSISLLIVSRCDNIQSGYSSETAIDDNDTSNILLS